MNAGEAAAYLAERRNFAADEDELQAAYDRTVDRALGLVGAIKLKGPGLHEGKAVAGKQRFALVAKKVTYAARHIKGQIFLADTIVNQMLKELGEYLSFASGGTWIQGPIKVVAGALAKTVKDYKLNFAKNKDLARGTLAAQDEEGLKKIASIVLSTCTGQHGMHLIKKEEQKPTDAENWCGYSGWNFAVVFKGINTPAEIQANSVAMMYGKMSKKDFMKQLHYEEVDYKKLAGEMGFEGGLGHLFYEIARIDPASEDGKAAAEIGKHYNNLCRSKAKGRQRFFEGQSFSQEYDTFKARLKTPRARGILVKH